MAKRKRHPYTLPKGISDQRETHLIVEIACMLAPKYPIVTVAEVVKKFKITEAQARHIMRNMTKRFMAFKSKGQRDGYVRIHPDKQGKVTKY